MNLSEHMIRTGRMSTRPLPPTNTIPAMTAVASERRRQAETTQPGRVRQRCQVHEERRQTRLRCTASSDIDVT